MLSIDEAIARERQQAEIHRNNIVPKEDYHNMSWIDKNNEASTISTEYHEQLAEWLEELKAIKSDGFTDDLLNMGFTKGYNRALDDFVQKVKEHQYVLCDVINSKDYGMFTIGIEQIAEELKEGRNNDA